MHKQDGDQLHWLVAVPNGKDKEAVYQHHVRKLERDSSLCKNYKFQLNDRLRVGTLDALYSLSDDLVKIDLFVETVVRKITRQIYEVSEAADGKVSITVNSAQPEHFVAHFQWDEAKYPSKSSIRELTTQISQECSRIEEELRTRVAEYQTTVTSLSAADRRDAGNLLVRNLAEVVTAKDVTYTEHITTLFVVVPKYHQEDWFNAYEKLCDFIVPRSSHVVKEEGELVLVNIKLFKNFVDEVKTKCREKRWTVREYVMEDKGAKADDEKKKLQETKLSQQKKILAWSRLNFTEAFSAWVHLKAVRLFVESVLRYGLPPNFQAVLIQINKKGNEKKVREQLDELYRGLSGGMLGSEKGELEDEEYFPYVFMSLNLDFRPAQAI